LKVRETLSPLASRESDELNAIDWSRRSCELLSGSGSDSASREIAYETVKQIAVLLHTTQREKPEWKLM
jgi:hypothetical protein